MTTCSPTCASAGSFEQFRHPIMNEVAALERASALCDLGRWDAASQQLRTILANDPHNERGLCLMAQVQYGQGAFGESLRLSLSAIAENPDNDWPHRQASRALTRLGQDHEAHVMARNAVRLAPYEAHCHWILAQALAASGSDLDEARTAADRAVSLAPHLASCHNAVGMVSAAQMRTEHARDAFLRALAIDPANATAHNELARLELNKQGLANTNGLARAVSGFARAVRANPHAAVSRSNVDWVLNLVLTRTIVQLFMIACITNLVHMASDAWLARLLPALLVILPTLSVARFLHQLTPPLRVVLMRRLRSPDFIGALVCDTLAVSGLIVGAASQRASSIAFGLAAAFSLIAMLTVRAQSVRRLRVQRRAGS
jgi:tetratricopeptide (TPR) repeat protein